MVATNYQHIPAAAQPTAESAQIYKLQPQANLELWAEHYNSIIEPVHGLYLDFSNVSEYEKPILAYLTKNLGWKFEYNNTFIRRPL